MKNHMSDHAAVIFRREHERRLAQPCFPQKTGRPLAGEGRLNVFHRFGIGQHRAERVQIPFLKRPDKQPLRFNPHGFTNPASAARYASPERTWKLSVSSGRFDSASSLLLIAGNFGACTVGVQPSGSSNRTR